MRLAQRVRDLLVPFDAGFELPPGVTAVRDPLDAFTDGYRFVVERRARRWAPPHEVVEAPASDSRHVLRGRPLRLSFTAARGACRAEPERFPSELARQSPGAGTRC